jgi:hypothetical protein
MQRKKRWLPLLLLLILLLALMPYVPWQKILSWQEILNSASSHADAGANPQFNHGASQPSSAPFQVGSQGPVYVPAGEARLRDYGMRTDYVIAGRVLSEEGEPLPGTTVSIHKTGLSRITFEWPAPLLTQTCDNQGRYAIQLDSPLHAFVVIRAQGYAQKEEEIDVLQPGTLARNYRLRTAPACVRGYVRAKDEKPIPGAVVVVGSASFYTTLDRSYFSLVTATTDNSGAYEIHGIPEGNTLVAAVSPTHNRAQEQIDGLKKGGCERVNFALAPGIRIAFVVKNRRGKVIPRGGYVDNGLGEVVFTVPADKRPFKYTVKAPCYRDKTILLDPRSVPSEVVLDDGPVFYGRVVTAADDPVQGAKVDAGDSVVALTDPTGRFSLNVSSESHFWITVTKPGFMRRELSFDMRKPVPTDKKIVLNESEGGIFGRAIYDDGMPVTRFRMLVWRHEGSCGEGCERDFEGNDGVFSVTDLPVGTYDLEIGTLPYSRAISRQFQMIKGAEIRKGFYYGEVLIQFPRVNEKK